MAFPDNCIRGIKSTTYLDSDGTLAANAFYFQSETERTDEWREESINWEDDDRAIEFTMNQQKLDGELRFKAGIAILPRVEIDRINTRSILRGFLSYERRSLVDNPYHGNILLRKDVTKNAMKKIASALALYARVVLRNQP